MNELMSRISKVGIKSVGLDESEVYQNRDITSSSIPCINIALSGEVDGGFGSGVGILAGPSKHYKSNTALILVSDYLKKHKDAMCLFYDSEFGTPPSYWATQGIDSTRVLHVPIENIEDIKFDLPQKLESIKLGDKVIIFVDSVGNLPSKKEATDALDGKSTTDMTRARELKSLFRIVTPKIKLRNLPALFVAHTYQTMELYSKAVVSGGTGIYYSADWIIIFGRQQEKETSGDKELIGWNFILNTEKSRFVKEKTKIPLQVLFDSGIGKYSGILDLAIESKDVSQGKVGKSAGYALINRSTGEIGEMVKFDATQTDAFLGTVLKRAEFKQFIRDTYKLEKSKLQEDDIFDKEDVE